MQRLAHFQVRGRSQAILGLGSHLLQIVAMRVPSGSQAAQFFLRNRGRFPRLRLLRRTKITGHAAIDFVVLVALHLTARKACDAGRIHHTHPIARLMQILSQPFPIDIRRFHAHLRRFRPLLAQPLHQGFEPFLVVRKAAMYLLPRSHLQRHIKAFFGNIDPDVHSAPLSLTAFHWRLIPLDLGVARWRPLASARLILLKLPNQSATLALFFRATWMVAMVLLRVWRVPLSLSPLPHWFFLPPRPFPLASRSPPPLTPIQRQGIGVVDETGFLKKGSHSAGVQRQYSGTAGKCENCQIGVFLTYATSKGHTFLDRRLYLPESWCTDTERRARAKIPIETRFASKPAQAMQMLTQAWMMGVPMQWVTGDEVYGDSPDLRRLIAQQGRWYVLAVRSHLTVWLERPVVGLPPCQGTGRPPTHERVMDETVHPLPVVAWVAAWPESCWRCLTVAEGAKGPRTYDWAYQRIVENEGQLPGRDGWLLVRRSLSDPQEIAYYLSNAPAQTPLLKLAQGAATRFTVEQCIEEAKGETGLDHYEVRHWHSWYRHITLSLMAHAFGASLRLKCQREKGGMNPGWRP